MLQLSSQTRDLTELVHNRAICGNSNALVAHNLLCSWFCQVTYTSLSKIQQFYFAWQSPVCSSPLPHVSSASPCYRQICKAQLSMLYLPLRACTLSMFSCLNLDAGYNLTGTIPSGFFQPFQDLQAFFVADNQVTCSLPAASSFQAIVRLQSVQMWLYVKTLLEVLHKS